MSLQIILQKFSVSSSFQEIANSLQNDELKAITVKGLAGSSKACLAASLYMKTGQNHMYIMNDKEQAAYFFNDIEVLLEETHKRTEDKSVFFFPTSYKRNLKAEVVDHVNVLSRTEVIHQITTRPKTPFFIVTYPEAVFEKVVNKKDFHKSISTLKVGDTLDMESFIETLNLNHFERVDFTTDPGQYAVRGGIIDVFSYAHEHPFRIELSGRDVDSLRAFDIVTQVSINKLQRIRIVPNILNTPAETKRQCILDFFRENSLVGFDNATFVFESISRLWYQTSDDVDSFTESSKAELDFTTSETFKKAVSRHKTLDYGPTPYFADDGKWVFNTSPQPIFNKKFDLLLQNLKENTSKGVQNIILSSSENQIKRLQNIFEDITTTENQKEALSYKIIQATLEKGFVDNDLQIACYTDHQIFERYHRYRIREGYKKKQALSLKELSNLKPGDYVAHIDHGIGRFDGLEKIEVNGKEQEALRIVYKDNDLLYLSIHALHRITRYAGKEGAVPILHKIGSPAWQQLKKKTKKRVKDIAKDLIKLYAQRKSADGHAFMPDTYLQHELEASFIYEDTPDQEKATIEVKKDMEASYPMDRLLCGDVGFGKTEIAIRAAFKVVTESKQVAVLVPTTILALQHYNTFKNRLADFPCNVDYVSRLKSSKQIKESLKSLKEGQTDIIIGTHRLVSKDVIYKDLGLLIVDEEQKFGVSVKEKIKHLRVDVDTLTLTATPIPRTLQFSLMGARDMSVINTPPASRYPIITELIAFSEAFIKEHIAYEISRGGQVYFVNNRVENIYALAETLQRWMPKLKIAIGHGQMQGRQLEQVMVDFTDGLYDILLATTIIESGLDIPNVNTIFINNAHHFGLSELHQLRGRVGRSNKKAFCYLICPPLSTLTTEARQRLLAIEEFSELGSGLNIAMRDLDIRGAGNLLGGEQSGFISEIGFDMYHKILDEAIHELKEKEFKHAISGQDSASTEFVKECSFESDMEVLIPSSYIQNTAERLLVYKEINNLPSEKALMQYMNVLADRFGKIPLPTIDLFNVVRLRWLGKDIGFERITLKNHVLKCAFIQDQESAYFTSKTFTNILEYMKSHPSNCRIKEVNGKLFMAFKNILSIPQALNILKDLKDNLLQ